MGAYLLSVGTLLQARTATMPLARESGQSVHGAYRTLSGLDQELKQPLE